MSQTKVKSGLLNFPDQTDFVKLPSGTTAQRPSSPEKGYSRYNTTDNKLEFWDGTKWQKLPGVVPPIITSISYPGDDLAADPDGGQTITINGEDFKAGATVTVDGTTPSVITLVSATEITFTSPAKVAGDYDIVVTNLDGGNATAVDAMTYNGLPSWITPAGNLGAFEENKTIPTITLVAAEPDSGTVSYSITTGGLPTGLTLTGADVDGTTPVVTGDTTYNFTVTANDDENQESTERAFNIVVYKPPSFQTVLYGGNGTTQTIYTTNDGTVGGIKSFAPDFVWIKLRDSSSVSHVLYDSLRGVRNTITSNLRDTEVIREGVTSFNSDGFTVGNYVNVNTSGNRPYVAWCWRAAGYNNTFNVLENGSTTSSATAAGAGITSGSITTNWSVSANRDAGFSIVKYDGIGTAGATVGHGLNKTPELVFLKARFQEAGTGGNTFVAWHKDLADFDYFLELNSDVAQAPVNQRFYTYPSSTLLSFGTSVYTNPTTFPEMIAYCFTSIPGYSKIGSYNGNSSTQKIYTTDDGTAGGANGFEPAFVIIKSKSLVSSWYTFDNKRGAGYRLFPNLANEESFAANNQLTSFDSDGFTLGSSTGVNGSGASYIYIAFANQY